MIEITIDLGDQRVRGKQSVRHTKTGISYIPKETRQFQEMMKMSYLAQVPASKRKYWETEPVVLGIAITIKMPKSWSKKKQLEMAGQGATVKPDLDNVSKIVGDTFNGVIFKDDSQIAVLRMIKEWGYENKITIIFMEA